MTTSAILEDAQASDTWIPRRSEYEMGMGGRCRLHCLDALLPGLFRAVHAVADQIDTQAGTGRVAR